MLKCEPKWPATENNGDEETREGLGGGDDGGWRTRGGQTLHRKAWILAQTPPKPVTSPDSAVHRRGVGSALAEHGRGPTPALRGALRRGVSGSYHYALSLNT